MSIRSPTVGRDPIRENAADPWMVFAEGNYNLTYTHGDKLVGVAAPSVDGLAAAPQPTLWQPPPGEGDFEQGTTGWTIVSPHPGMQAKVVTAP